MRYLSVCSGIEAATVAWHPLGWEPVAFAEIEKFPSAVLAHHYPSVPNLGDFTGIEGAHVGSIDLLVGGTPCQSFSVAGLRGGLADDRGNLALEFLRLAQRTRPRWLVWENVPGVLSSNGGRDFGSILGGLVELGYGWAYRVLDAQYFGVPQRRRRVFVVGYLGDWRRAAAVLFERHSLQGHPPPGREAREGITKPASFGLIGNGEYVDRPATLRADGGDCGGGSEYLTVAPTLRAGGNRTGGDRPPGTDVDTADSLIVARCVTARQTRLDWETENFIPIQNATRGKDQNGLGIGGDTMFTLDQGSQHAVAFQSRASAHNGMTPSPIAPPLDVGKAGGVTASLGSAVRRLTPEECEALQGFPRHYTLIPFRGKPAADGPRYKALGNSMAVPVMRWLGERINAVGDATR